MFCHFANVLTKKIAHVTIDIPPDQRIWEVGAKQFCPNQGVAQFYQESQTKEI